jgi:hypothetical protein
MTIPSRLAGASVWLPLSTGSSSNGIGNGAWNGHHHYHQQPPQPWRQQQQQHRSARRGQRVHRLVLAVVFVSMSVWMLSQFHVYNRLARKNQQLSDPPARDDLLLPAATETTAATVAAENDKDARNQEKGTRTVGVAVTVTGCTDVFVDGAAVLQYSIMRQQQHNRNKKLRSTSSSRYQYHFYVIYHPSARECAEPLKDLNFTLVERESPVLPEDIQGNDLRATIAKSGTFVETFFPSSACEQAKSHIIRSLPPLVAPLFRLLRREGAAQVRGVHHDAARCHDFARH